MSDDPADDPTDRLDSHEDREGDPFEFLSDPDADRGAGATPATSPAETPDPDGDDAEAAVEPAIGGDDPANRSGDPFEVPGSVFERMDAGGLDGERVWEELADAEARGPAAEARERTYADVSKHRFCEGCEHFGEPPHATCSHEGTEILEFLDTETVRVVDCPVVAERRELERQV